MFAIFLLINFSHLTDFLLKFLKKPIKAYSEPGPVGDHSNYKLWSQIIHTHYLHLVLSFNSNSFILT